MVVVVIVLVVAVEVIVVHIYENFSRFSIPVPITKILNTILSTTTVLPVAEFCPFWQSNEQRQGAM